MKNKNAVELSLNVIVVAAIVLIVLVVSIMIYTGIIGDEKDKIDGIMVGMEGDYDGDGIEDIIDRCPCDYDDPEKPREVNCKTPVKECNEKIKQTPTKK